MGHASPLNEEDSYAQGTWGPLHVPVHFDLVIPAILPQTSPAQTWADAPIWHRSVRPFWHIHEDFMAWLGNPEARLADEGSAGHKWSMRSPVTPRLSLGGLDGRRYG
jgi:hypothetical protein